MAEWLRRLIFSTLNRSSSHHCGLSLARVTCEASQVLLAGSQVVLSGISRFAPTTDLTWLKMSEIILKLMGRKTQLNRASTNFQNQEVQDFQPSKFGSEANET